MPWATAFDPYHRPGWWHDLPIVGVDQADDDSDTTDLARRSRSARRVPHLNTVTSR